MRRVSRKKIFSSLLAVSLGLMLSACQHFSRLVIADDPAAAQIHLKQGQALAQTGDWPAARDEFLRAVRRDENRASAWLGLAETYLALEKSARAEKCYHRAHELSVGDSAALNRVALGLLALGRLEPALAAADQAVALGGEDRPRTLLTRGRVKMLLGDPDGARADLRAALWQAPPAAEALRQEINRYLGEAGFAP